MRRICRLQSADVSEIGFIRGSSLSALFSGDILLRVRGARVTEYGVSFF